MPVSVLEEISKISQSLQESAGGRVFSFKVAACISFKKNKVKITWLNFSKKDAYTKTFTQVFSVNFEKKNMKTTILRDFL